MAAPGARSHSAKHALIDANECSELITQLKKRGIRDARVLKAIEAVPRDLFVPPSFTSSAYLDQALPLTCGQTISQPFVVAYMTEKLAPLPTHDVLEIGTGSGWQTAILAALCRHVYSIERHEALYRDAQARLARLGIGNVTLALGDGSHGWPEPRTFDRIIVTAAAAETPLELLEQLREGGRMIAPVGKRPDQQRLAQFDKTHHGITSHKLIPVRFVPLVPEAAVRSRGA